MLTRFDAERSSRTGFTLVELLVAATLALLLLSLVVQILIPSLRVSRKTTTRMDLHQKALVLNLNLERDFKRVTRSSFSYLSAEEFLSLHRRTERVDQIQWESQTVSYQRQDETLRRWEADLGSSPAQPVQAGLPMPSDARVSLAINNVISFLVEKGSGPSATVVLDLEDGDEKFQWKRIFFLPTASH